MVYGLNRAQKSNITTPTHCGGRKFVNIGRKTTDWLKFWTNKTKLDKIRSSTNFE